MKPIDCGSFHFIRTKQVSLDLLLVSQTPEVLFRYVHLKCDIFNVRAPGPIDTSRIEKLTAIITLQ